MSAYVISEVSVLDEEKAAVYRELAAASIESYGGRYLSRGQRPEAVEGEWPGGAMLIVLEFPDMEAARRWYDSPEYAEALALRATALDRRLLFVEGGSGQG
ncbi:DUF1330 domain-containing protein [Streptomyces sp. HNM0575]|uniref:DUF1330 domain-containing protein n=1 Tax=Streptomyces sp. HNM0575 TaxID=2716338 RepID=UPI00145D568B|nr:DUF1330 domain-containing protein [Streptomyces sp. HNM0575]NLU72710.1 DUF1330 domain-containing protein [Streptomyces sp. HNM0575]